VLRQADHSTESGGQRQYAHAVSGCLLRRTVGRMGFLRVSGLEVRVGRCVLVRGLPVAHACACLVFSEVRRAPVMTITGAH
jgi:hypothetical protein